MANNPKRHHYLPQMIQRNFLADSATTLWYYDRKADTYEKRTPRGIAHTRNLYSYDGVDPRQRYLLEKAFSTLEDKAAPAFLKLQRGEQISQEEHTVISEFVGMQYYRTPSKIGVIKGVIDSGIRYAQESMLNQITDMTEDAFSEFVDRFNGQSGKESANVTKEQFIKHLQGGTIKLNNAKDSQLSALVDAGTNLGMKLSARRWLVLHTEPGHGYITSDVGLHLTPDGEPTRATGYGPGSPGMAIIFPFEKNTALMITSHTRADITHVNFENPLVFVVNSGLARVSGQIYSSDKPLLERLVKAGDLAKTSFEPIFDEEQMKELAQKHFFKKIVSRNNLTIRHRVLFVSLYSMYNEHMIANDFDTYVEKYIEGYLFSDLNTIVNHIDSNKHPGNLAYMLMTALCSAMEFNGLLLQKDDPVKDDRVDASTGFGHYVKHYLEKVDERYAVIRELGPRLIRNGIAHAYATKGRVAITRVGERDVSHLIRYTADETLVINANYLYEDFKQSYFEYAKPNMLPNGMLRDRVIAHYESIRNVYKTEVEKATNESHTRLKAIPWLYRDLHLDYVDEELEQNGGPILVS